MSVAQLEQPEVPADGIERFVGSDRQAQRGSRRHRSRLGPALEMSRDVHLMSSVSRAGHLSWTDVACSFREVGLKVVPPSASEGGLGTAERYPVN